MSGTNLTCAVTALVETQALAVTEPVTHLCVDTAAGVVEARAEVADGRVTSVTVDNAPSFVVAPIMPWTYLSTDGFPSTSSSAASSASRHQPKTWAEGMSL